MFVATREFDDKQQQSQGARGFSLRLTQYDSEVPFNRYGVMQDWVWWKERIVDQERVPVTAITNKDLTPVKWVFPTFPSQDFKDQLGQHLAQYASGSEDWAKVKDFFVTTWASEKKASKEG